jgi:hypothetical protein
MEGIRMSSKVQPPQQFDYERLAKGSSMMGRSALYAGEHHILYAVQELTSESYKRFYYDEILSIVTAKTSEYLLINTIAITVTVLSASVLLLNLDAIEIAVSSGFFTALAAIVLVSNLTKGPTCRTVIQTKVIREEISCLRHTRSTKKALPKLQALILDAQPVVENKSPDEPVASDAPPSSPLEEAQPDEFENA